MLSVTPEDVLSFFVCEVVSGGAFDSRYIANFKIDVAQALGRPAKESMQTNLCDPSISDKQIRCIDSAFPSERFLLWFLEKYGQRSIKIEPPC